MIGCVVRSSVHSFGLVLEKQMLVASALYALHRQRRQQHFPGARSISTLILLALVYVHVCVFISVPMSGV